MTACPTRPRPGLGLLVAAVLATALTACSADADDGGGREATPAGAASSAPVTPSTPTEEPPAPNRSPLEVDPLPDGELEEIAQVRLPRGDGQGDSNGVVFNDDTIVVVSRTDVAIALDRATGQERWRTPLGWDDDDRGCVPTSLPPGATTVVLFAGLNCNERRILDLTTGTVLDSSPLVEGNSYVSRFTRPVALGPWSYVVGTDDGTIRRIDPDGDMAYVAQVDLPPDTRVFDVFAAVDSDVLIAHVIDDFSQRKGQFYVGIRITGGDDPAAEEVWSVPARRALRGLGLTLYRHERGFGGSLTSRVDGAGDRFQIAQFDLATGALSHRVELDAFSLGGTPEWATPSGREQQTLPIGHQVYATSIGDPDLLSPLGLVDSITRYDLDAGTVPWSWVPPRTKDAGLHTSASPVAVTDDGRSLYVGVSGTLDPDLLVELDVATGTETRRWRLPDMVEDQSLARFVIVGDLVLCFDDLFSRPSRNFMSVLRVA